MGGPRNRLPDSGKDDRHRRIESYWQFLREAWRGIAPLLQDSAQVVVRIGGTRLAGEQLQTGLLESLNCSGHTFKLMEARQTAIKKWAAPQYFKAYRIRNRLSTILDSKWLSYQLPQIIHALKNHCTESIGTCPEPTGVGLGGSPTPCAGAALAVTSGRGGRG